MKPKYLINRNLPNNLFQSDDGTKRKVRMFIAPLSLGLPHPAHGLMAKLNPMLFQQD